MIHREKYVGNRERESTYTRHLPPSFSCMYIHNGYHVIIFVMIHISSSEATINIQQLSSYCIEIILDITCIWIAIWGLYTILYNGTYRPGWSCVFYRRHVCGKCIVFLPGFSGVKFYSKHEVMLHEFTRNKKGQKERVPSASAFV